MFCLLGCNTKQMEESIYTSRDKAKIGDIVLQGGKIISPDNYSLVKDPKPIGIVIVPKDNSGDGRLRLIGLDFMTTQTNSGTQTKTNVVWGKDMQIPGMQYKNQIPLLTTEVWDVQDHIVRHDTSGYLPLSQISYYNEEEAEHKIMVTDEISYPTKLTSETANRLIPSPVLENDIPNPLYTATSYINSEDVVVDISKNPLADFDGEKNTRLILAQDTETKYNYSKGKTDFLAAKLCSLYTRGGIRWYLPAAGELGYFITNLKKVNDSRILIGLKPFNPVGDSTDYLQLWSSTLFTNQGAICGHTQGYFGGTNSNRDASNHQVLPAAVM